jgi:serine/threonine-protein kinase
MRPTFFGKLSDLGPVTTTAVVRTGAKTTTSLEDTLRMIRRQLQPDIHDLCLIRESEYQSFPNAPLEVFTDRARYTFGLKIGEGGMGEIYLGCNVETGETVTMKKVKEEVRKFEEIWERFRREAQLGEELKGKHPGVIRTLDYQFGDDLLLITPYYRGATIADLVERKGRFTVPQTLMTAYYLCEVEEFFEHENIVYRDLKGDNVILLAEEDLDQFPLVFLDLGLAKKINEVRYKLTREGVIVGAPVNIPPETLTGKVSTSVPGEQFAVGMLMATMLLGELPGNPESSVSSYLLQRRLTVDQERKIPEKVLAMLRRLLDPEPRQRYVNIRALKSDIAQLLTSSSLIL